MRDVTELLNKLLGSEIKGELLILFHKNPGLTDSIDGIARRIGRTASLIETDIRDFLDLGILRTKYINKSEVISLNASRDNEIQETLGNYLKRLNKV